MKVSVEKHPQLYFYLAIVSAHMFGYNNRFSQYIVQVQTQLLSVRMELRTEEEYLKEIHARYYYFPSITWSLIQHINCLDTILQ